MAKRNGRQSGKIPARWVVEEALPAAGPIQRGTKKAPRRNEALPLCGSGMAVGSEKSFTPTEALRPGPTERGRNPSPQPEALGIAEQNEGSAPLLVAAGGSGYCSATPKRFVRKGLPGGSASFSVGSVQVKAEAPPPVGSALIKSGGRNKALHPGSRFLPFGIFRTKRFGRRGPTIGGSASFPVNRAEALPRPKKKRHPGGVSAVLPRRRPSGRWVWRRPPGRRSVAAGWRWPGNSARFASRPAPSPSPRCRR